MILHSSFCTLHFAPQREKRKLDGGVGVEKRIILQFVQKIWFGNLVYRFFAKKLLKLHFLG